MATETVTQDAKRNPLNGYSPEQAMLALETIAHIASEVREYFRRTTDDDLQPFIVISMIDQIGAIADQVSGREIVGSVAEWCAPLWTDKSEAPNV